MWCKQKMNDRGCKIEVKTCGALVWPLNEVFYFIKN